MRIVRGLILILSLLVAPQVAALDAALLTATLSCTDFRLFGSFRTDRDNTGLGNEAFFLEVTDGTGARITLSDFPPPGVFVPATLNQSGTPQAYTTAPASNPITLRLVSIAGNGLPEDVAFSQSFNCADLVVSSEIPATPWWSLLLGLGVLVLVGRRYYAQR